jgi:hypothetical protein
MQTKISEIADRIDRYAIHVPDIAPPAFAERPSAAA